MAENKKEINLSEKIKNLFEVEYLDSMADVQGDVSLLFKKHLQEFKEEFKAKMHKDINIYKLLNTQMQKHFGDKLNGENKK